MQRRMDAILGGFGDPLKNYKQENDIIKIIQ